MNAQTLKESPHRMKGPDWEKDMTYAEAADYLGIPEKTLRHATQKKGVEKLKVIRYARNVVRIRKPDLIRWREDLLAREW
jgi:excisionase family DNA binding protein